MLMRQWACRDPKCLTFDYIAGDKFVIYVPIRRYGYFNTLQ
jgi:hypothetical protein